MSLPNGPAARLNRVSITAVPSDLSQTSARAASDAALKAGIDIRKSSDLQAVRDTVQLLHSIWGPEERELISITTLRALSHSDNYVYGAYVGGRMVGAIVGFVGWHDDRLQLHSHILGVSPDVQGRHVGYALKQHQRAWCLGKGISTVTWTYDPLVSRNAYFNLAKLGATVTAYYPSFYGAMNDEINGHDDSDRVLIEWALGSPRAAEASTGNAVATPSSVELEADGAVTALSVGGDDHPIETAASGDTLLVGVPRDIVELRKRDPRLGSRWRAASRSVLQGALDDGYVVVAMAQPSYYVLQRVG